MVMETENANRYFDNIFLEMIHRVRKQNFAYI